MKRRGMLVILVTVAALIGLAAQPALAAPPIVQPGQSFAGRTYPDWSTRWWQWAFTLTGPDPFTDPTGASCGAGQRGVVWFLGGHFGETSPSCTIPHGKAVLVPIVNGECSTLESTPPQELNACAAKWMLSTRRP